MPEEKVSNCLVFSKKYANTTNISNAARRPVIVAAAVYLLGLCVMNMVEK